MMPTTTLLSLLLLGFMLFSQTTSTEDGDMGNHVKIPGKTHIRKPTGQRLEVPCTTDMTNTTLKWLNPQSEEITSNSSFRVYVNTDNTLAYRMLELNDTGEYTCVTTDGAYNATVLIAVFVMPTYMVEGLIILIINASLLVIFAVCLIQACIRNRRNKDKYNYSDDKLYDAEQKQRI